MAVCEGLLRIQPVTEPVDIALWCPDEEFPIYPEGARDKRLLYSPKQQAQAFLVKNHRYLFKRPPGRYPDQFWAEVAAYQIGCSLGLIVPPAFVAWDSRNQECGALIEWFLDYPGRASERYVPGGDIMISMDPRYDRRRGKTHNLTAILHYLTVLQSNGSMDREWRTWWCDTLVFDALIGNTDRHQDNWGLLWSADRKARMAPAFDNGTSLGHEIAPADLAGFSDPGRLDRYIQRGAHHLRWDANDRKRIPHLAFLGHLFGDWRDLKAHVRERLTAFDIETVNDRIMEMTRFAVPTPLSEPRAALFCRLTERRYSALMNALDR